MNENIAFVTGADRGLGLALTAVLTAAAEASFPLVTRQVIDEVYTVCDRKWRGIGTIPQSGWRIRDELAAFDAGVDPPAALDEISRGVEEFDDRALRGFGHELLALVVGRRVQRQRQRTLDIRVGQLSYPIGKAGRRYGDPFRAEVQTQGIVESRDGPDHGIEIQHRFTHSHKYHIGNMIICSSFNRQYLLNDFSTG